MVDIREKKQRRLLFLNRLYEVAGANIHAAPMVSDMAQELGWSASDTYEVVDYLDGEHLVETSAMESRVSITHKGLREVEAALSEPDKATHYFPPASNVIIVHGDVHSSPIQQGSHNSTQTTSYAPEDIQSLHEFLVVAKDELTRLSLAPDDRSQADAEITTLQAQLTAPRPNGGILKASGEVLHGILLGAAGNLATDLLKFIAGFGS